jgi:hypothetical protein
MRFPYLSVLVPAVLLIVLGGAGGALGAVCELGVFNAGANECQITGPLIAAGTFAFDQTLHILAGGSITVPALPDPDGGGPLKPPPNTLTLNITGGGGFIMDIGAAIVGDVSTSNGTGATININAHGDIFLDGNGSSGARITSNQTAGSCNGGAGGNIFLTADTDGNLIGDITTQPGSVILSSSKCPAGTIKLKGVDVSVDGLVQSKSGQQGTGATQPPGGGPIFIDAACDLTITPAGVVSSSGSDAGADLVHLAGGCVVQIFGLVESTGKGQTAPNTPVNHCRDPFRPGKPLNSTACVEIWAGTSLLIQSDATHNGEVSADLGAGTAGVSWIDLFANGPITITETQLPYAVHANNGQTNALGGTITVGSKASTVDLAGFALQANALAGGGAGGSITVEAFGALSFGTSSVQARGANSGGGHQQGGTISGRSFNSHVTGSNPGELNADGGKGQPTFKLGTVQLKGCANGGPGVSYSGNVTPALTILADACGGSPTFPAFVVIPICQCPLLECPR